MEENIIIASRKPVSITVLKKACTHYSPEVLQQRSTESTKKTKGKG
jgi:hypothetical protein